MRGSFSFIVTKTGNCYCITLFIVTNFEKNKKISKKFKKFSKQACKMVVFPPQGWDNIVKH